MNSTMSIKDFEYLIQLKKKNPEAYKNLVADIVGVNTDIVLASLAMTEQLRERMKDIEQK